MLGYFWSLARPLFFFGVIYVFFTQVVNRGSAVRMVRLFLGTGFAGGRHARRVQKIMALETSR